MNDDSTICTHPSREKTIGAPEIEALRKEFGGEGIGGLVEMFKEEGPGVIAKIAAAIANADMQMLRRAAHELKGACANFGAHPLEALCQEMESAALLGQVAPLLDEVRAEFLRVQAALEQEANQESPI